MKTYVYFVRGEKHRDMALLSVQSVRRVDSHARILVISDDGTDLSALAPHAGLSKMRFDAPMRIMPANVAAQCQVVLSADVGEELWFLDADTLLVQPLHMPAGADLAFTWRDHVGEDEDGKKVEGVASTMPYNYGVVGVTVTAAAREAFLWMRERVRGYHPEYQDWYGNQLAAAELAGPPVKDAQIVTRPIPLRPFERSITSVRVAQLPCETWNWTPQSADEDIADKLVLHFKGVRRNLMDGYGRRLGLNGVEEAA